MWKLWKTIIEKVANFQSSIIFSLLYFLLVVPLGLVTNLFKDFLRTRQKPNWYHHDDFVSTLPKLKSQ